MTDRNNRYYSDNINDQGSDSSYSSYPRSRSGYPNDRGAEDPFRQPRDRYRSTNSYNRSRRASNVGRAEPNQVRQVATQQSRRGSYSSYGAEGGQYRDRGRYLEKQPKKRNFKGLIIFVVLIALIGGGVWFYLENRTFTVNINGMSYELKGSHTLDSIVADGMVHPQAGDMLAIDGTLYEEGAGNAFEAKVNGADEPDHERKLEGGDEIIITDGNDVTEPADETTTAIPFSDAGEQGWGPIHLIRQGVEGENLVRTGTLSGITQSEVTREPVDKAYLKYYPNVGEDKVIALTLDDGPWGDTTEEILDILKENEIKVTFFVIGEQIDSSDRGAALVKRAYDEGHQICTHTYTHASGSGQGVNLGYMSADEQIAEITKGLEAIERATGAEASKIFRAPGGNYSSETERILEPYVTAEIGWTIDTNDWRLPGSDALVSTIMSEASSGDIILMHDGGGDRNQTVEALRQVIPQLKAQGYRFVTMDELLEYPPAE